jgi:hypothetical protein
MLEEAQAMVEAGLKGSRRREDVLERRWISTRIELSLVDLVPGGALLRCHFSSAAWSFTALLNARLELDSLCRSSILRLSCSIRVPQVRPASVALCLL